MIEGLQLRQRHRYNAGAAAARSADLHWALSDPEIDGVWLARGGYGCIHCLPILSDDLPAGRTVIGSSDATALLVALSAKGHSNLIHGPMLDSLAARVDDQSRAWIYGLLTGSRSPSIAVKHVCGPRADVSGPLIGGNLTVLASLAGTEFAMQPASGIILLEDVGEALYRLDRSVTQLRLAGALQHATAILLGQFIRCRPPEGADFTLEDVLVDLFEPLGIPVVSTAEIGHGERNLAWRYGSAATIHNGAIHFGYE